MAYLCAACGGRADGTSDSSQGGALGSAGGSFTSGASIGGNPGHGGAPSQGGMYSTHGGSSNTSAPAPSSGGRANGGSSAGGASTNASGGAGVGGVFGSQCEPVPTGPGTVTGLWEGFCVATFTSDYKLVDPRFDPAFSPRAGERYLILSYGATSATLGYLTSCASMVFSVGPTPDGTLPFTSNCAPDPQYSYVAAFANVRVFANAELTQPLCDIEMGATMPWDATRPFGASLESQGPEGYVYKVFLNAFSANCSGASEGHILVQPVSVAGATHYILPFTMIEAEKTSD